DIETPGRHTLSFSMREDGFTFDQFALSNDIAWRPGKIEEPSPIMDAVDLPTDFPEKDFSLSTPSAEGFDDAKFDAAMEYLLSHCNEDGLSETMVLHRGRVIFEGDSVDNVHNIWSCSKSFTSTALGLLIDEGKCSLDTIAADHEPELSEFYPDVRLSHFASMTSGYSAEGRSRWNDENSDWSWTPYKPEDPMFSPGSHFAYWDEAQMMFGRVLTRIAGEPLVEYLERQVFTPIRMGDVEWKMEGEVDGVAINNGCTNIHLSARQLARFGLLMMANGRWKSEQVIPEEWISLATSTQVSGNTPVFDGDRANVRGSGSYGFNWWLAGGESGMPLAPPTTFYASGLHHNVLCVVPEWDLVIVRMGVDGNPNYGKHNVYNEFLAKLALAKMR
ncbi:MAG: serine hydrolase, partial [Planctomycetota bacterium]